MTFENAKVLYEHFLKMGMKAEAAEQAKIYPVLAEKEKKEKVKK